MARRCAFCDLHTTLTREHVWPECFLSRTGRVSAHFSQRSQKVHGADYVVSDVCSYCNNKLLSPLDAYLCKLYDEYFVRLHGFHSSICFQYDFPLLTRMLLKVAYNSARSAGSDPEPLTRYRKVMLGREPIPIQVAVCAELISPTEVRDPAEPAGFRVVMPQLYRSAITKLVTPRGEDIHTRIVAVNSFYFHLVLPLRTMGDDDFEAAVDEFLHHIQGVVHLSPSASEVILMSSPQDGISSMAPHLKAHAEQYEKYFSEQRKQRGA